MNSLTVVVLVAALAVANAGLLAPAAVPVAYALPAIHPHHVVAPLALPHPVSYAAPATIVKQLALPVYAAPVVKTVYAAPVVKHVYAAPVVKTIAPAPVLLSAPAYKHYH